MRNELDERTNEWIVGNTDSSAIIKSDICVIENGDHSRAITHHRHVLLADLEWPWAADLCLFSLFVA